jgi:methyl-accepting chemotaxis protein/methyl-accepting chemotaxis protein-1 (serine sensor receptor)
MFYLVNSMDGDVRATELLTQKQALLGDINTARADLRASLRAIILYTYAQKADLVEANWQKTQQAADLALARLGELEPLLVTEEGRAKVDAMAADFRLWRQKSEAVYSLCKANNPVEAEAFGTRETKPIAERSGEAIARMTQLQMQLLDAEKAHERQGARNARIAAAMAILLSIVAGVFVLRVILGITGALTKTAAELSSGSAQVAAASSQISGTSQLLANGASEQAVSLQETTSATAEIVSMTNRNAESSKAAMELMESTSRHIVLGNQRLEEMHSSMKNISGAAQKISKINRTIDEIAFQTNILALNAAVEAARAGEAGMGFAVVADEVRNLAQRCAQAAKETAELIEQSIQTSTEGSERLTKVSEAISAITGEAEKVQTLITEVSLSSEEQVSGLRKISKAVGEMEYVTQATASAAEETAAAGQQLSAQSEALRGMVSCLDELVNSSSEHLAHKKVGSPAPVLKPAFVTNPVHSTRPHTQAGSFLLEDEPVSDLVSAGEWK